MTGMLAGLIGVAGSAGAQCGGLRTGQFMQPSNWHQEATTPRLLQASSLQVEAEEAKNDSTAIVGFWHVKFISEGSAKIPDGTEVDAGYAQWHSDGTEIMNSAGRSPVTGAFCLGVWASTGPREFQLNHFAAAYDSTGVNLIGPANIRENVHVGPKGKHFAGTFTIDQYDEAGNLLAHVQGKITGTRIDVDTLPSKIY